MTDAPLFTSPRSSLDVRAALVDALRLDLVGPGPGEELSNERLRKWERPSNWYLTGFLVPADAPPEDRADENEDEDADVTPDGSGLPEESTDERRAARKAFFPSSMGLSFLVGAEAAGVDVVVRWGDYTLSTAPDESGEPQELWQRTQREVAVRVAFDAAAPTAEVGVPGSRGLQLHRVAREVRGEGGALGLPVGTQSVSVFLVNRRSPDREHPDRAYVFQAELEVVCAEGFVPRADPRGTQGSGQWDDAVADLQYADTSEFATGHGVSVACETSARRCERLRTSWLPSAEVERTQTFEPEGVELGLEVLGGLTDGKAAQAALTPLVDQYRGWLETQGQAAAGLAGQRRETADALLQRAKFAAERMMRGITLLSGDADALDAFRVANRAVARAMIQRRRSQGLPDAAPRWRAFQLAFVLLNLGALVDPKDRYRNTVDLLFFPTGGGKTEAYLGLAAFAMVLRRLRHRSEGVGAGAGVSVIMRYTLRLLTLDQLGRAAGLVCALELEREQHLERLGTWPFEVGLWVGKAATPNKLGRKGDKRDDTARSKVRRFQQDPKHKPSPIPLESCPWCDTRFTPASFELRPNADQPTELRIVCSRAGCDFSRDRALPIIAVDEMIYRRLPAFLIATVDKFASLPWMGPSGALLGGADRGDARGFYGPSESGGKLLTSPIGPPDLIIQDELHLISGPLGTMAGLYEVAIEALCLRASGSDAIRPKIVASTATVRHAQAQIQALFGRNNTMVFPPPGPDRRDSFFARTVPSVASPARLYLGVAAPGRSPKEAMRRTWRALMGAAKRLHHEAGGEKNLENPADPYMTVLGYFNSLRELGGARRILEEEVQNTLKAYGGRLRFGQKQGHFRDRGRFSEVVELTSRVTTDKVAEARRRLEASFSDKEQRVDCAIATNMISVGLDIPRLGLMVVLGQPKSHAEYIQATSRVGRDERRPGLVVTLLNVHKPRDRSHFERFEHYHQTFYRSVEVGSVTPFSARALDRGFCGAMVALARHSEQVLAPARGAESLDAVRTSLEEQLLRVFLDRLDSQQMDEGDREERGLAVRTRVGSLLEAWSRLVAGYRAEGVKVQYQKYEEPGPKPLLREMLETQFESPDAREFRVNRSLRDVEPEVHLYLREANGQEAMQ